ncbi:MAG: hypothetical protein ABR562_05200 [Thermoplasmatota archaeon]|nr:hypothetical protein [Halobacteriales archaeon]
MVIRKMRGARRWRLYSRKKNPATGNRRVLGTYSSRDAALRRERQVQYFKHAH